MKIKLIHLIEFCFYLLGLYLCLVWAKWIPRPRWIQEDIEPVYGILSTVGLLGGFFWRLIKPINDSRRRKNALENTTVDAKTGIHIGDETVSESPENYDEENIIKNSKLKTEGDFHLGDGKKS